jgi:hypothetical protein
MSYAVVLRIAAAGTSAKDDFWQQLEPALIKAGYRKEEVGALCSSVSRTGLLAPASGLAQLCIWQPLGLMNWEPSRT